MHVDITLLLVVTLMTANWFLTGHLGAVILGYRIT